MKKIITPLIFLFAFSLSAQYACQDIKLASGFNKQSINNNAKSDSIDIFHYHINLDATKITSQSLIADTELKFASKIAGVSFMEIDLLKLNIDSIYCTWPISNYNYNDTLIRINFGNNLTVNDTQYMTIYYHGTPQGDATGWGGFHFASPYYYNLGVGFGADPHTYGRAWFPCFDNFVEKSTYSFAVKTEGGRKAYCNGVRTAFTHLGGDTLINHWFLTEPIPTYLASVAISDYEEINSTHNGMPVMLVARAGDTTKLKNSFTNLTQTYDAYVSHFGPYMWQKMGYALTTQGAMEHATSIHYPRSLVNGTLAGEDIMAHELAHHWWGNLITCKTAEDMWINEGMAEFSSHLYEETIYDRERYLETVQDNAFNVLKTAHISDDGFWALYGVDHDRTYGMHTYQKGAMVGHNLRGYLGDSLFFAGVTQLMNDHKYGNLDSYEIRDELQQITGYNLSSFFADWIFQPGFPQFGIDSVSVIPSPIPEYTVEVGVSQRQRAATHPYTNVPITLTYFGAGSHITKAFSYTNSDTSYSTSIPFEPSFVVINFGSEILTGTSSNQLKINSSGQYDMLRAMVKVNVSNVVDSAELRIEHHWAGPKGLNPLNFRLSSNHYWTVTGDFGGGLDFETHLNYSRFPNNGRLDEDLLSHSEDSILLLYRLDARSPWMHYPHYQKNVIINPNNGVGRMELSKVLKGEYVFANGAPNIGIDENTQKVKFKVLPNPVDSALKVELKRVKSNQVYRVYNSQGILLEQGMIEKGNKEFYIDVSQFKAASYTLQIGNSAQSFIVAH